MAVSLKILWFFYDLWYTVCSRGKKSDGHRKIQ